MNCALRSALNVAMNYVNIKYKIEVQCVFLHTYIVDLIDEVIMNFEDKNVINSVKKKVNNLMQDLPIFKS